MYTFFFTWCFFFPPLSSPSITFLFRQRLRFFFPGPCVWMIIYIFLPTTTFSFLITFLFFLFRRAQIRDGSTRRIRKTTQKNSNVIFFFFLLSFTSPRFVTVSIDFFVECVSIDSARTIRAQSGLFFWGKMFKNLSLFWGGQKLWWFEFLFEHNNLCFIFFIFSSDEFPKRPTIQRYVMETDTPHLIPCRMRPLKRRVCV